MRFILVGAIVFSPLVAWGADKLPLKRGIFVETSVGCSERSNTTVVSFWGEELNTARKLGSSLVFEQNVIG